MNNDEKTNEQQVLNQYAMIWSYNAHVERQYNYYGGKPEESDGDDNEYCELLDLKFFDAKKFDTIERQKKFRQVLLHVLPKMDVNSGRDWVAVYIAYHYLINRLYIMKGYSDFFTDIERLLPGLLVKVKQEEIKGDKRYKAYTEALASECTCWFIEDECLPEMSEWRSSKYKYLVDDNRRKRIQNIVSEIYQGLINNMR